MSKSAFLLFIILIEIIFLLRPVSNPFLGKDYTYDGFLILLLVLTIICLVLVVIFFITQRESRKRIREGTYTLEWLFKFCLKIYLILFLLNTVNEMGMMFYFCEGQSPECAGSSFFRLFLMPFFILIIIFAISFLPVVIYKRFYKKKKILRAFFIGALSIAVILPIIIILRYTTCSLKTDSVCLAEKALKSNNYLLCEGAINEGKKDICYYRISWKPEIKDVDVCLNINEEFLYNRCLVSIAINSKNAGICDSLKKQKGYSEKENLEVKNDCIFEVSRVATDESICNKIIDDERVFDLCIEGIGRNKINSAP
jgi:hypothetical protein